MTDERLDRGFDDCADGATDSPELVPDGVGSEPPGPRAPLAVRWRPRTFADVVGQRAPVAVLRAAAASEDPPRQVLLAGGSGLGKTTLGRIYTAALCCETPPEPGEACGTCRSCVDILVAGRSHPDVVELDAASSGGKDEIRDLAVRARVAPLRSGWRVWIIDEAHGLSKAGIDAFLKLLEEPPPQVVFVLATTEIDRMPATLRGRCLEMRLASPTRSELADNLGRVCAGEGWDLDVSGVELVLDATDPELGVRGTLTTLGRLEPLLSAGPVDARLVADVLGVASTEAVDDVLDAVAAADRVSLFSAFDALLAEHPEPAVRQRLLDRGLDRLRAAAAAGRGVEAATDTVELLADAAPGRTGLAVALARAARPRIGIDAAPRVTEELAEAVTSAARTADELKQLISESAVVVTSAAVSERSEDRPDRAPSPKPSGEAASPAAPSRAHRTEPTPAEEPDGAAPVKSAPVKSAPGAAPGDAASSGTGSDGASAGRSKSSRRRRRTGARQRPSAADVDGWFSDPATSSTAPVSDGSASKSLNAASGSPGDSKRQQKPRAATGSGTPSGSGSSSSSGTAPGRRTPQSSPGRRPQQSPVVEPDAAVSAPQEPSPPKRGLAGRRDSGSPPPWAPVLDELRSRNAAVARLLSDCRLSVPEPAVLQVVVPPNRVDDARRGRFREDTEAAAAAAGFSEVRFRRPT